MLSGVAIAKHGIDWNFYLPVGGFIEVPTVFSAAKEEGLSTAMVVGKTKLRHLAAPGTVDHYEEPEADDLAVANAAARHLLASTPNLLFVHLPETDAAGHTWGWMSPQQLGTIARTDQAIAVIRDALEEAGVLERTVIIVTSDHGGIGTGHAVLEQP